MYFGRDFSEVAPGEIFDAWFDFARDLRPGSTAVISSATFTLEVVDTDTGATEDSSPSSQLSGSASIESSTISERNTVAVQRIDTPVVGNRYLIKCLATFDDGQKLQAHSHFWCRPAS